MNGLDEDNMTILEKTKEFLFDFIPFMICTAYSDAFDAAGLNSEGMKDSIIGYSLGAIIVGLGVTLLTLSVIGTLLFVALLVFCVSVVFFKYVWPVYVLIGTVCFFRWRYVKKNQKK